MTYNLLAQMARQKVRDAKLVVLLKFLTTDELHLLYGLKQTTTIEAPAMQLFALVCYTADHADYSLGQFEAELARFRGGREP